MHNDMYDTFDDQTFEYHNKITFKKRNKKYLQMNQKPRILFKYGNTAEIVFNIHDMLDEYSFDDEEDYLSDKTTVVTFYNFRHEPIGFQREFNPQNLNDDMQVEVIVSAEDSKKYFNRGIYYCDVVLKNQDETEVNTVLCQEDCLIKIV